MTSGPELGWLDYLLRAPLILPGVVLAANPPKQKIAGMTVHAVQRLDEAIGLFREV